MGMLFSQDTDTSAAELSATFGEQVGMKEGESCNRASIEVVPFCSYCKRGKLKGSTALHSISSSIPAVVWPYGSCG